MNQGNQATRQPDPICSDQSMAHRPSAAINLEHFGVIFIPGYKVLKASAWGSSTAPQRLSGKVADQGIVQPNKLQAV